MNADTELTVILFLPLVLQVMAMLIAMLLDRNVDRERRTRMAVICLLILIMLVQEECASLLRADHNLSHIRLANAILGFTITPVILLQFIALVDKGRKHTGLLILVILNAIIYLSAFVTPLSISFNSNNTMEAGPLGFSAYIVFISMLVWLGIKSLSISLRTRVIEAVIPVLCALLLLTGSVLDLVRIPRTPIPYLAIMIVSSCLLYYIWLRLQFAREHEQEVLAEHRIRIMVSQIQPHFLFNTLSTIQALCRTNPEKAFETTGKFGSYLRQNINALEHPGLIPVDKEIGHTRIYSDIEKMRFPKIAVEYDIQDSDFSVPPLSIQPLVENSIRHGLRNVKDPKVTVSTRCEEGYHVISIIDNGCGFDPNIILNDNRDHIGIRNVRERIERMLGGTIEIESGVGLGTSIFIRLPENRGGYRG